ncbi:C1 family peptidase [Thalassotalea sediminis]|uniref:C1 family peptidase n=1 Tax=Thalassotalea sediminis TaxID=1759089 RepID=UPI002573BEC6|nr:C1 family peptidase [Thalassotalea sediminis]
MQHLYCRSVVPNQKCCASPLYQQHCHSTQWQASTQDRVDLREFILSPVMDQGLLNACTGCALSAAMEITLNRQNNEFFDDCSQISKASAMYIYYHERLLAGKELQNTPVLISDGFQALQLFGVCCADLWPYPETHVPKSLYQLIKTASLEEITENLELVLTEKQAIIRKLMNEKPSPKAIEQAKTFRQVKYCRLSIEHGIDEIKHALSNQTPVIFGFMEPRSFFEIPSSGIMPMPSEDELRIGGHAVCAVGFDDEKQALLIRNSYGSEFGLSGYLYMPYEFILGTYISNGERAANAFDFYCLIEEA